MNPGGSEHSKEWPFSMFRDQRVKLVCADISNPSNSIDLYSWQLQEKCEDLIHHHLL